MLGLVLIASPIRVLWIAYNDLYLPVFVEPIDSSGVSLWTELITPASDYYIRFYEQFVYLEIAVNFALTIAWLVLIGLFFAKKRVFKRWFIYMMLAQPFIVFADAFIAAAITEIPVFDKEFIVELLRSLIAAVVWSIYIIRSRRVANTFVY
ncbi:hypothetical protein FACS1894103_2460 [Campylobacterota bacterium]|nr:hypothetical protein FACS1894103_2460 [Campylobacterota bacterium]